MSLRKLHLNSVLLLAAFAFYQSRSQVIPDFVLADSAHGLCFKAEVSGRIHATWSHNGAYYAIYDKDLTPLKSPSKISATNYANNPRIALGAQNSVVVWSRWFSPLNVWNIYAQLMDLNGNGILGNIGLDDGYTLPQRVSPDAAFLDDTTIECVWMGNGVRYLGDLFGAISQVMTTSGVAPGYNILVSDDLPSGGGGFARVVSNPVSRDFFVVWRQADSAGRNRVYARLFSYAGTPMNPSLLATDDTTISDVFFVAAGLIPTKKAAVVWGAKRGSTWSVEQRFYGLNGNPMGSARRVNSDTTSIPSYPTVDIAVDSSGKYIVVWEQVDGGNSRIFGQRFLDDGTAIGTNFPISTHPSGVDHYYPSVTLCNGKITTGWQAYISSEKDYQIWANVLSYDNPVLSVDEPARNNKTDFRLSKNYPNPFNSSTIIEYDVDQNTFVNLSVYNVLGQQIKGIVAEYRSKGHHRVSWDGKTRSGMPVPSGLYLCRLIVSNRIETSKMLLIR